MCGRASVLALKLYVPVVAAFLCGCGGSSGTAPIPLSSTTRHLQPNDQWTYAVTVTDAGANATASAKWTDTVTMVGTDTGGVPALVEQHSVSSIEGEQILFVNSPQPIVRQDVVTGQISQVGARITNAGFGSPTDQLMDAPIAVLPGDWSNASTVAEVNVLRPLVRTGRVVGAETVSTPAGAFRVWKVQMDQPDPDFDADSETLWYAPQLGAVVKKVIHSSVVSVRVWTAVLTTTNVPLAVS